MAITKRDVPIENRGRGGRPWCINATSADATGNEILLAAQATKEGLKERIRIRDITINCAVATTVVINEDTTALLGPFSFSAAAAGLQNVVLHFEEPISLGEGKALRVDAGGAGAVCVVASGDIVSPFPGSPSVFQSTTTTSTSTTTSSTSTTTTTSSTTSTSTSTTSTTSTSTTSSTTTAP